MRYLLIVLIALSLSSCVSHRYNKSYDSGYRAGRIEQWKQDHKHLKPSYKRR